MYPRLIGLLAVALIVAIESLPTAALGGIFRRILPQDEGREDWMQEAKRNLSRFETRLLRHTLGKLHSSHDLGIVPFELFDPVVTCPPPSKLMRLDPGGPVEKPMRWVDGAKWMCVPFPRTARPGCAVLSFGSNDQFEFEQAALDMTPCTIHTFDCTTGMLGNATKFSSIDPARHVFHPYCVGSREMVAMNPKQVLNWEGLLRVVRPPKPVALWEDRFRRRLQQEQEQQDEGAAGPGLVGAHNGEEYVVAGGVIGRRDDAATAAAAAAEAERWASVEWTDGGVAAMQAEEDDRDDHDHGRSGTGSWLGSLLSSARRRLLQGRSGSAASSFWDALGLGGGGGGSDNTDRSRGGRRGRRRGNAPEVFILKIDVEGFEWQLLAEWGPRTPGLPAFIAIEIHNWMERYEVAPPAPPPPPPARRPWGLYWWLYGEHAAKEAAWRAKRAALEAQWAKRQRTYAGELSLMFLHLARLGYAVVARENNPNGDINGKLCAAEFLFIRVRGPEEGRPGVWDWTHWFASLTDGLVRGGAGRPRR